MALKNKGQAQVTRRTILRGAAVAASAVPVLLAGVSAAHAKASQKAVASFIEGLAPRGGLGLGPWRKKNRNSYGREGSALHYN